MQRLSAGERDTVEANGQRPKEANMSRPRIARGTSSRMRGPLVVLGVVAASAAVAVTAAGSRGEAAAGRTALAELQIAPAVAGGPRGAGFFRQKAGRLRGWVVVWGLEPHSTHAVHLHGPNSTCGTKADPAAVHKDLRADSRGVAYAKVDVESRVQVLRKGFYYNVHRKPSNVGENPEIACGNVAPIR